MALFGALGKLLSGLLKLARLLLESSAASQWTLIALWALREFDGEPQFQDMIVLGVVFFIFFCVTDIVPMISKRKKAIPQERRDAKKAAADLQARTQPLPEKKSPATTKQGRPAVAPFQMGQ